ncbi:MAG: hypothetical protein WD557_05285 [Dehalococcoidia bacterium]
MGYERRGSRGGGTVVDRLMAALFDLPESSPAAALAPELREWVEASARFRSFAEAHRDKIRKKLRTAADPEACRDVRAELLTALLLLADRRLVVEFEAYGSGKRGPDLTVTFRANQRFNVEVTRVRAAASAPEPAGPAEADQVAGPDPETSTTGERGATAGPGRWPNVLLAKLRQLPPSTPNVVLLAGDGVRVEEAELAAAARALKVRADRRDDSFFAGRGFAGARGYYAHWLRLSGVYLRSEVDGQAHAAFWPNPESRHPLSRDAATAVLRCLNES